MVLHIFRVEVRVLQLLHELDQLRAIEITKRVARNAELDC